MDKDLIESFSTKDEVLQYGKSIGIELNSKKSLKNLKQDIQTEFTKQLISTIDTVDDLVLSTIEGDEETIRVYKDGVLVDVIPSAGLIKYCEDKGFPHSSVLQCIDNISTTLYGHEFKKRN